MLTTGSRIVLFILVGFIAPSCDDTDVQTLPAAFYKTKVIPSGSIRVFNATGEIRDYLVLRDFDAEDSAHFNSVARSLRPQVYGTDTILFTGATSAEMRMGYIKRKYDVTRDSVNFILTRLDTSGSFTYGNNFTRHVSYFLGSIKPEVYSETLVSSTAGFYAFRYRAREKLVVRFHDGQLVLPYIFYKFRLTSDPGTYFSAGGQLNNNLKKDFYKNLKGSESVALVEYRILFEKVK